MTEEFCAGPADDRAITKSGPLNKAEAVNLLVRAGHDYRDVENILAGTSGFAKAGKPQPIGPHSVLFLHTTGRWYIEEPAPEQMPHRASESAVAGDDLEEVPELSGLTKGQATVALHRLGYEEPREILVRAQVYGTHLADRHLVSFHGGDAGFDILPRRHGQVTAGDYEARWLSQVRDIAADRLVTDAQAGGRIRALLFPQHIHEDDGTVEGCPGCFPPGEVIHVTDTLADSRPWPGDRPWMAHRALGDTGLRGDQAPEPALPQVPWPDLGTGWDVAGICAAIRLVDAHLDASTAQAYRDQPLAADWARITKVCEEAGEVWKALSKLTGENPRKGVCGTQDELLGELGDTASAALCAIQHITKDTDVTWAVFIAALAKAIGRVPQERPAPSTTTEGEFSS